MYHGKKWTPEGKICHYHIFYRVKGPSRVKFVQGNSFVVFVYLEKKWTWRGKSVTKTFFTERKSKGHCFDGKNFRVFFVSNATETVNDELHVSSLKNLGM